MSETEFEQKGQPLINLAALYATVILIIGTVVSEWPPEGQEEWFPTIFNDVLFVFSAVVTILITFRILLLIWQTDPLFGGD